MNSHNATFRTYIEASESMAAFNNRGARRQAIIWTNAEILLIWPLRTNLSEMLIEIRTFLLK